MPLVDHHLVRVLRNPDKSPSPKNVLATLFWGDEVDAIDSHGGGSRVSLGRGRVGFTNLPVRTRSKPLLRATFIDVGQGDACILESPSGRTILVDGGEHQRLARYLAKCNSGRAGPTVFDAVVVTHGDADHFDGLSILALDAAKEGREHKRITFATRRIFHNGLVKRPVTQGGKRRSATQMFGKSVRVGGRDYAIELVDDLEDASAVPMNRSFRRWLTAIRSMRSRESAVCKRIERGDDDEFSFFDPEVGVEVLGPRTVRLSGGRPALPFLSTPGQTSPSASHTINGHSIVLRLTYGNVRLLLAADLNAEAEGDLLAEAQHERLDLMSEVLKVPHHGSGDFASEFLHAVKPVISIVSAGDEDQRHEYIHPRANLMGAIGKCGRTAQPVVLVTDLAAFDRYVGPALPAKRLKDGSHVVRENAQWFYGRERTTFGVVHVRTDGKTLFVGTASGRADRSECYAFEVRAKGRVRQLEELDRL